MDEKYIRIPNSRYSGDPDSNLAVKELDAEQGVKCLYSSVNKKVQTYLFDNTLWTDSEADEWVKSHSDDSASLETIATIQKSEKGMLAIASNSVEDRDGEVISVEGWDLKAFKSNPVLLWMHNRSMAHNGLPVGKAKKIGFKNIDGQKCLVFEPELDDTTEFNRTVKKFVDDGLLNTFSVGFLPKNRDGNVYTSQELLEISLVPVPSNSTAMFIQRAKDMGFAKSKAIKFVDRQGAVAYRAYEPADEDRAWNASAADKRVRELATEDEKLDMKKYRSAFTWYDDTEPDKLGSYKLPHHDVIGGELVTVYRGVVLAMASLLSGGGAGITDSDRKKTYDHLAKHLAQFDKTAPDYKLVESQELKDVFDIYKDMIEEKSFQELKAIMRTTRKYVKEARKEKAEEKRKQQEEMKKLKLETVDRIGEAVTRALGQGSSHKKGGKK